MTQVKRISFKIKKGPKFATEIVKEETDLTSDMLFSGDWKAKSFKPYNFKALGAPANNGALHPLMKVRHEFRQIFFEMGFEEMPTNRYDFGEHSMCYNLMASGDLLIPSNLQLR